MLAAIESRLEELFETIESLPSDKVEAAEKVWMDGHAVVPHTVANGYNLYYLGY